MKNFQRLTIIVTNIYSWYAKIGNKFIEQILSNHTEIHGAGELDLLPLSIEKSNWKNIDDFLMIIKKIRFLTWKN